MCSGFNPTISSSSCTFRRRSPFGTTSGWISNGSPTMSPTVRRGFSEVYGSCSTICMSRRHLRSSWPFSWNMSRPSNSAVPLVGFSNRISTWARVDLPHPDSPTTPSVSPWWRSNETPSTARTCPMVRLNTTPWVIGKCLTRSRTWRIGSAMGHHLLREVAGAGSTGTELLVGRHLLGAALHGARAARVERAPRWDRQQVRRQALDGEQLLPLGVQPRDRPHQPLGVGARGLLGEREGVGGLHAPARVHPRARVGALGAHARVGGDQDEPHAASPAQLVERVHDRGL